VSHRGVVAIFVIGLVALLSGCGGSDDEPSLTKAEFIKQGDAICAEAEEKKNAALAKAFQKKENQSSQKAVQERLVTDVALPPIAAMAEELSDLGAPDDKATAIVEGYEAAVEEIEEDPAAAVSSEKGPFAQPDKLAAEYGFKECSGI
jgi:hypothetical protein